MPSDIAVYACEISLVDHRELDFFAFVGGGENSYVEVEGALEDGCVRDGVDGVEGEEFEGLFETVDYAGGEEEEEACLGGGVSEWMK